MGGAVSSVIGPTTEEKVEYLRKSPCLVYTTEDQLTQLAKCFHGVHLKEGEEFTRRSRDHEVYIVAKGELMLCTLLPNVDSKIGEELYLSSKKAGDIVSTQTTHKELADHLGKKRYDMLVDSITVTAKAPTTLLKLNFDRLGELLQKLPELIMAMRLITDSQITHYLKAIPMWKDLGPSKLALLAGMSRFEAHAANTFLIREGEIGDKLYIMLRGTAKVLVRPEDRVKSLPFREGSNDGVNGANTHGHGQTLHRKSSSLAFNLQTALLGLTAGRRNSNENRAPRGSGDKGNSGSHMAATTSAADSAKQRPSSQNYSATMGGAGGGLGSRKPGERHSLDYGGGGNLSATAPAALSPAVTAANSPMPTRGSAEEDNIYKVLADTRESDYFGEMALMADVPRTASVETSEPCLLLTVDRTSFQNFLKVCPGVTEKIEMAMRQRVTENMSTLDTSLFQGATPAAFAALAADCRVCTLAPTEVLFKEGDDPSDIFVVILGTVRMIRRRYTEGTFQTIEWHLTRGKPIGEASALSQRPRAAAALAVDHSLVVAFPAASYLKHFAAAAATQVRATARIALLGTNCTIHDVLALPEAKAAFRSYQEAAFCTENINFFDEAARYESVSVGNRGLRAHDIVERFIRVDSPEQINIAAGMRQEIIKRIEAEDFGDDLLLKAKEELHTILMRDTFPRFVRSGFFHDLLKSVGAERVC